jgi:hypothetical protein
VFIVLVYTLVDMNLMKYLVDMNVKHGSMEDGRTLFIKVPT